MKGLALSVVLAGILIGALGSLSLQDLLNKPGEVEAPAGSEVPSYFFEEFRMRVMDVNGRPEYRLAGRELVSYPGEADTRIAAPRLQINAARDGEWLITADTGAVSRNGKLLRLSDEVVMTRAATARAGALRIDSASLLVDAGRRVAHGEGEVRLHGSGWRVNASAVVANFESDSVELQGSVHGRYQPGAAQ